MDLKTNDKARKSWFQRCAARYGQNLRRDVMKQIQRELHKQQQKTQQQKTV